MLSRRIAILMSLLKAVARNELMSAGLATYLIDVLGITRFGVAHEGDGISVSAGVRSFRVIFILEKALSREAQELFLKMVEAMKLQKDDFLVVEKSVPNNVQAKAYVSFDPQYSPLTGKFCVLTLSPEILLQKPALKKQAWSDLQKVIKQISIVEVP